MAEKYVNILNFIHLRYLNSLPNEEKHKYKRTGIIDGSLKPSETERRFMDFMRIVIEGGWVVQENLEWINILDFL